MIMMMGMISKYIDETGMGTLVLSDGEIREFTKQDWIDTELEPGMGQQVLYKSDHTGTQIRTITKQEAQELKNNPIKEETPIEEPLLESRFSSIEEAIEHYLSLGYKKARDSDNQGTRTVSMRYYDQVDFGEALITAQASNIEIKETKNGKPI